MMQNLGRFLRVELSIELIIPLVLIVLYIAFLLAIRGSLPTPDELVSRGAALYARFGYEIIFIGAALEALVVINFVVPGATAVALGAIFARSGQVDLTYAVIAASAGAMLGYIIDFTLGYFGFGQIIRRIGYGGLLEKTKQALEKSAVRTFGLGFIHPNTGSVISLAAGTFKTSFLTFLLLSTVSTIAWVSFWGILVFSLGEVFLIILTKYIWVLVLLMISVWILTTLYGMTREKI